MFVISGKIDKEMCPSYDTLVEEKSDATAKDATTCEPADEDGKSSEFQYKRASLARSILICVFCFIAVLVFVNYVLMTRNSTSNAVVDPAEQAHLLATTTIKESQNVVELVRQANAHMADTNKREATGYLNSIQEALKKRVEFSVRKISQLILERVQDIENQLAVFEKSVSTLVAGIVDVTKHSIADIKADVSKVSGANDTVSTLNSAVKRMEDETFELIRDLSQMFTYQGGQINDLIYQKAQNITDRVRMILVSDRKLFRDVAWQHQSFCYNISKQNYDISTNLETVFAVISKLRQAVDTVNVITSTFVGSENDSQMVEAKRALSTVSNDTKQALWAMMNAGDNFLGTTLKELAFQKHMEMRDFVYKSYGTVMMSVLPAVEKVTRDFQIVRDSHWKQIIDTLNPEMADVGKLMQSKASLIVNDTRVRNDIVKNAEFKSARAFLENNFKDISSRVNTLFATKQSNMIEGFALTLVMTKNEQLPVVSTWSLQNYLPSDVCPVSVEFQTYLKGTIEQQLNEGTHARVFPSILNQAIELDDEFEQANENEEMEIEKELAGDQYLTITNQSDTADSAGLLGSIMSMIDTVMTGITNAGFALDGPIEVYIEDAEDDKKKKK